MKRPDRRAALAPFRPRRGTPGGPAGAVCFGLLVVGLLAITVYATYRLYTSQQPGGNDFYSRWMGGRAFLREGLNPYSEEVTLRIQQGMYGRPARPDEDQVAFAYPLYSLLYFWPLCFVDDYALVQAIWIWLLLTALVAAIILWLPATGTTGWPGVQSGGLGRRLPLWLQVVILAWAVVMYHTVRAVILGQLAIFVLLALVAAVWAMSRGRDGLAAACLALATIKPQMVYLAIPWLLLWAAGQRRWRLWWGFGLAMAVLILASAIALPSWLADFFQQALTYPSYTVYGSLTWMIVDYELGLGPYAVTAVQIVLALGGLMLIWQLRRGTWQQMLWLLGVLLLLTNFLTTRIATTNYLLLLPWAVWGFAEMYRAWGRRGAWLIAGLTIVSVAGLWALFLATIQGDFETAPVYYPFPLAMTLLLAWLWTRLRPAHPLPASSEARPTAAA